MRPLFFLLMLAGLSCGAQIAIAQAPPQNIPSTVDSILKEFDDPEVPGVAIGIMSNDSLVFKKGYGSANLEHDILIDPDTSVFTMASVSKQFTVFAILLLEEEGRLSLEDDIRLHIPELYDYGSLVTLRHLASNTSGLRSDLRLLGMSGVSPSDYITADMIQDIIFQQKELNFEPGAEFRYSNSGFFLLAEVVTRASGLPFRTFMKERIFDPLGMDHTFVMDDCEEVVKHKSDSYQFYNDRYHRVIMNYSFAGSTGIWMTLNDFAKWAANFEKPIVGNNELFSQMNAPTILNDGTTSIYGLGQFVDKYNGGEHIYHGGGSGGFRSFIRRYPSRGLTVLLLSNNGMLNPDRISQDIANLFLNIEEETKADNDLENSNVNMINLSRTELDKYVGRYLHDRNFYVRNIMNRNDTLIFVREEQGGRESPLLPIGKNRFQLGSWKNIQVTFDHIDQKKVMKIFVDGAEVDALTGFHTKDYSSAELEEITGLYYSDELKTWYHLQLEDETLRVHHPKIGVVALTPIHEDGFLAGTWRFNYLKLERDDNQEVKGFRISEDRVRNVYFAKTP